jgi:hypothetical protein
MINVTIVLKTDYLIPEQWSRVYVSKRHKDEIRWDKEVESDTYEYSKSRDQGDTHNQSVALSSSFSPDTYNRMQPHLHQQRY